jgi:hypothetical protein
MIRWAVTLHTEGRFDSGPRREVIWQKVAAEIPPAEMAMLKEFAGPFSADIFHRLAKGEPLSIVRTSSQGPARGTAAAATGTMAPETAPQAQLEAPKAHVPTAGQLTSTAKAAHDKFLPHQQPVTPSGLELPLPDTPQKPFLASGGWQVILPFKTLGKIGVFNLATAKFDGFVDCSDPAAICSSGGNVLSVFLPSTSRLELYDLNTLEKKVSGRLEIGQRIIHVGMGMLNPSHLFVVYADGRPGYALQYFPAFVRVPDLAVIRPETEVRNGNNNFGPYDIIKSGIEAGVDESGTMLAFIKLRSSPTQYGAFTLMPDGRVLIDNSERESVHTPQPSYFGKAVVGRARVVPAGKVTSVFGGKDFVDDRKILMAPVAGYSGFVARVYDAGSTQKTSAFRLYGLPGLNPLWEISADAAALGTYQFDPAEDSPVLLASAWSDRLVYINPSAKKIHLLPLGLRGLAKRDDVAHPGKPFQRKVLIPAGASAVLENGPKGMTFEPTTLTLNWSVPADVPRGQEIQVILLVKAADGSSEYRIEKVSVP